MTEAIREMQHQLTFPMLILSVCSKSSGQWQHARRKRDLDALQNTAEEERPAAKSSGPASWLKFAEKRNDRIEAWRQLEPVRKRTSHATNAGVHLDLCAHRDIATQRPAGMHHIRP